MTPPEQPAIEHRFVALLKAHGLSQSAIVQETGKSLSWVKTVLRSPAMKALIKHYSAELERGGTAAARKLAELSSFEAMEAVVSIVETSEDGPTRLRAAQDILDRSGVARTVREERDETMRVVFSVEDMARLAKAREYDVVETPFKSLTEAQALLEAAEEEDE